MLMQEYSDRPAVVYVMIASVSFIYHFVVAWHPAGRPIRLAHRLFSEDAYPGRGVHTAVYCFT